MEHHEMVTLIRDGVPHTASTWADLGAGTGNFTRALAALLAPGSVVYAIDRDARAIEAQRMQLRSGHHETTIHLQQRDFTQRLGLPPLDGVLMANALHFVRDQEALIGQILRFLRPRGHLLIVEYDVSDVMRWVPYPVSFERLGTLAQQIGLATPTLVGKRRSPSSGIVLYAAVVAQGVEV